MAVKPSVVFKTYTLSERKFPQNHDAVCIVSPAKAFIYSTYNPATDTRSDYTFPVHKLAVKTLTDSDTVDTPNGFAYEVVEARVRIITAATTSATGKFTIDGSDITGATAIPLDDPEGTITVSIPTSANTGSSGDAIAFAVSGDTDATFKGEVEVVYKPTGQFSVFL